MKMNFEGNICVLYLYMAGNLFNFCDILDDRKVQNRHMLLRTYRP